MKLICFGLLLALSAAHLAAATNSNEYCSATTSDHKQLETQCATYAYHTLKPFMDYLYQLKTTIQENETKYLNKDNEIKELREKLTLFESYKNIADKKDAVINELRSQLEFYKQNIHDLPSKLQELTTQVQAHDKQLNNQIKELGEKLKKYEVKAPSCIPYGKDPGIHEIKVSTSPPFDVLCDSETAGPGWTVIQQRINGKEDFYRNWTTYRQGFGSFDGDFFLGLEKIHQMTKSQPHMLYIHMEQFDGTTENAQYDNFTIAGEADNYRLSSLGKFSGSARSDYMRIHESKQFSTFDRDHDISDRNCAINSHGGWWYSSCTNCNLNGKYFDSEVEDRESIYWYGETSLKTVKMLIRPKTN